MKKAILLSSIIILMVSCEKITLETADTNVPVVEGYIHPGKDVSVLIKKQLLYNSDDTTTQYLDSLDVTLCDGVNTFMLENVSTGVYEDSSITIVENKEYTLEFAYNGKIVTADTETPAKPADFSASACIIEVFSFDNFDPGSGTMPEIPDPVTLSFSNPDDEYHMIIVECTETDPTLINSSTDMPTRAFRSQPGQGASYSLDSRQFIYYGTHRLILFRLNTEYAALYEQIGTSSLDIQAPPSNVINGLGIFTGINSDTLQIEVVEQ
jgi:Domain of unknown function (DUF4249)